MCGNDGVDPSFPGTYLVGPDFGLAAAVVPSAHIDLLFRAAVFGRDVGPLGLGEVFKMATLRGCVPEKHMPSAITSLTTSMSLIIGQVG